MGGWSEGFTPSSAYFHGADRRAWRTTCFDPASRLIWIKQWRPRYTPAWKKDRDRRKSGMGLRLIRYVLVALLGTATILAGCSPRQTSVDEVQAQVASLQSRPADQLLSDIFARYRNASQYSDQAVVRVTVPDGPSVQSEVAPLSVWFLRSELYVRSYDVRLFQGGGNKTAWIDDPTTNQFDHQVLRQPTRQDSDRPRLENLLSDPILAERLGSGLAGPPPQLEWLFSPEPMKHLFTPSTKFAYGDRATISGAACFEIEANTQGQRYRFWIDVNDRLIRRVDLPDIWDAASNTRWLVALELREAMFRTEADYPQDELPARPKFVSSFVGVPPETPPTKLGSRARTFRLSSRDSRFTLTDKGADRDATLLLRYSGDAASQSSLATLHQWATAMPASLRSQIRVVVVVDENRNPPPVAAPLSVLIDQGQIVSGGYQMQPGALVVLDKTGKIAWSQHGVAPESLVVLGGLVGDVLSGVDVPSRVREQWNATLVNYRKQLQQHQITPN